MIMYVSLFIIGMAMGYLLAIVQQQFASDAAAKRRAKRRALLGLEDRPPRRSGAIGTARIHRAQMRPARWEEDE